jgi:adenosylmethionine-8-amino-7-oxononanoate aminotransferase
MATEQMQDGHLPSDDEGAFVVPIPQWAWLCGGAAGRHDGGVTDDPNATFAAPHTPETDTSRTAYDHLWMHFTRMSTYADGPVPTIVRGDGAYIYDANGKRYLDGLSGLFAVQVGHGRTELAEVAAKQASELAYFPVWGFAHPKAVELAERLSSYTPGNLNKVFFTSGGGEAVETAWKAAKQYFKLIGKPNKYKAITRAVAYHGTPHGALSLTGVPRFKMPFEPLVPGSHLVVNTNMYRTPIHADDPEAFGRWAADQIEQAILFEGPDTVAAVVLEPVQNAGGCLAPPPGYFQRVREICDTYDVLLVSDEVICAFGRIGTMFGCEKYGYVPDIITCAKGMTSGYSPLGAAIFSDRVAAPFYEGNNVFAHGYTFGGHPVSTAVALANLDIFEREGLLAHVLATEASFRSTLQRLDDLPIVGDIRGDGYFYAVELVADKASKQRLSTEQIQRVLYGFVGKALFEAGLYCRPDDRGDPVVLIAPPLICGDSEFAEIEQILRDVLTRAWSLL